MAKKHNSNKVIIDTIHATGITHTQAAEMFGVSTRWIRELLHRYNTGGYQAFEPQSRRPHTNPRAITDDITNRVLTLRQQLTDRGTDAGAHAIKWHLEQEGLPAPPHQPSIES
ncbi:helix-turn-helix domain-containing protein [Corynebacterium pseudotuberculosis]|nr:helix-turn-helix domain-containing protein [Corynebacterium pseudotuberculosis]QGX02930.1 helix-turn-helix domain-containing protein [Corynebacterium pseudotuberculosis Cp162]